MLLDKLKDVPGVADGDRILVENGIYYRVWEVELCGAFQKKCRVACVVSKGENIARTWLFKRWHV